jgi:hypothetical protein
MTPRGGRRWGAAAPAPDDAAAVPAPDVLVLSPSSLRRFVHYFCSAILVLAAIVLAGTALIDRDLVPGVLCIAAAGLAALLAMAPRRMSLTLTPSGFSVHNQRLRRSHAWAEVEKFEIVKFYWSGFRRRTLVTYTLKSGKTRVLPTLISPPEQARLLEEWRRRWSPEAAS